MPVKWKIFLSLNFILALPAFIGLIFLIIKFSNSPAKLYWVGWIGLLTLSIMIFNSFLNIFLLQRYYPDKLIPTGIKGLRLLLFILIIIVTLGLLMICIIGTYEEFGHPNRNSDDRSGIIVLSIFSVTFALQLTALIMQGQLPRIIRRNHQNSMHSLIDSIGQSSEHEN